jgi:hypothetical protein
LNLDAVARTTSSGDLEAPALGGLGLDFGGDFSDDSVDAVSPPLGPGLDLGEDFSEVPVEPVLGPGLDFSLDPVDPVLGPGLDFSDEPVELLLGPGFDLDLDSVELEEDEELGFGLCLCIGFREGAWVGFTMPLKLKEAVSSEEDPSSS